MREKVKYQQLETNKLLIIFNLIVTIWMVICPILFAKNLFPWDESSTSLFIVILLSIILPFLFVFFFSYSKGKKTWCLITSLVFTLVIVVFVVYIILKAIYNENKNRIAGVTNDITRVILEGKLSEVLGVWLLVILIIIFACYYLSVFKLVKIKNVSKQYQFKKLINDSFEKIGILSSIITILILINDIIQVYLNPYINQYNEEVEFGVSDSALAIDLIILIVIGIPIYSSYLWLITYSVCCLLSECVNRNIFKKRYYKKRYYKFFLDENNPETLKVILNCGFENFVNQEIDKQIPKIFDIEKFEYAYNLYIDDLKIKYDELPPDEKLKYLPDNMKDFAYSLFYNKKELEKYKTEEVSEN